MERQVDVLDFVNLSWPKRESQAGNSGGKLRTEHRPCVRGVQNQGSLRLSERLRETSNHFGHLDLYRQVFLLGVLSAAFNLRSLPCNRRSKAAKPSENER